MSRRLEITVPNEWAEPVRECLQAEDKCNFNNSSEKPHMIVEIHGNENTVFLLTIPGPSVSSTLEILRKNAIGKSVGRIILTSLDFIKPDLSQPLTSADLVGDSMEDDPEKTALDSAKAKPSGKKNPQPLVGFQHFQKARKTTEEMYNEISNGASMNINTWINLIGASFMAAGGLATSTNVFIVASMLVSPIMGPILGMTFGYRVADWPLFKTGFINEVKMSLGAYVCGILFGLALGDVGNSKASFKWPNSAMVPAEGQTFYLIISILVSAAAGMVLGVSLTAAGGNALVGTAISAGLLPPIVNAGMLMAYSFTYAKLEERPKLYGMGYFAIIFYATHVVTIVLVANFIFWLKDVDPRFRDGEDTNFNDIPSLVNHKKRLKDKGQDGEGSLVSETAKAQYFAKNIWDDIKDNARNATDKAMGFGSMITEKASEIIGVGAGGLGGTSRHRSSSRVSVDSEDEGGGGTRRMDVVNPMQTMGSPSKVRFSPLGTEDSRHSLAAIAEEGDEEEGLPSNRSKSGLHPHASFTMTEGVEEEGLPSKGPLQRPNKSKQEKVFAFYRKFNPTKLDSVPAILAKYSGREDELLDKLKKQYNVAQF